MSRQYTFTALEGERSRTLTVNVHALIVAGWTGRDADAVEHHIRELEAIGIPRPAAVPTFYRVATGNLTSATDIQVSGLHSTGEVEFVLLAAEGTLWVGVGSDHTDRELEKHSVTLSKQACAKPLAASIWRFDEVASHWDSLQMQSHAWIAGQRRSYQHGHVSSMRHPADLIAAYSNLVGWQRPALPDGTVMFCGTLPVHGTIEFADRFELDLHDPRLGRSLHHEYTIDPLPVVG